MEGAQWKAPSHGDVRQGGGKEAEDKAGVIGSEDHYGCLLGLRETFGGGVIIYIPWEGADSFRWRLFGSGGKFEEGAEAAGTDVEDFRAVGSRLRTSETFESLWYKWYSCLAHNNGWCSLILLGPWAVSTTGWPAGWQKCSRRVTWQSVVCIRRWVWQWRQWYWRRFRRTSSAARIPSPSISLPGLYRSYV